MPPLRLRVQGGHISHPLKQPNTYDFQMNFTMSVTVAQSMSVGYKLGCPTLQFL